MKIPAGRRRKLERKALSMRALAARLGVSHVQVVKAAKSGRLSRSVGKDAHGRYRVVDAELAMKEWRANAARPAPTLVARRTLPRPGGVETKDGQSAAEAQLTLAESQIRVNEERRQSLALKNLREEGRLVDGDKAERDGYECARIVREAILAIPDRISSELAAESDTAKVHLRLEEELRLALMSLSDIFEAEAARAEAAPVAAGGGHGR